MAYSAKKGGEGGGGEGEGDNSSYDIILQDYLSLISSLPERDQPSFFGLPANIDRSSQRTVSSRVISQLKVVMRSETSGDRFDRAVWSSELNPILSLWKKLNQVPLRPGSI